MKDLLRSIFLHIFALELIFIVELKKYRYGIS